MHTTAGVLRCMWQPTKAIWRSFRALVEEGAEVDHVRNDGYTALHAAAQNGHLEVVRALLRWGRR